MFLKVKDVATADGLDEKTVLDWIKNKGLPAHKENDRYQINRVDLLEWANNQGISIPPDIFEDSEELHADLLSTALQHGGIHYDLPGDTPETTLREVVSRLTLPPCLDPEFLLQTLLAREAMGSTAMGNGIAIPHARNPIVGQTTGASAVSLCFLKNPIDFNALDGKPVTILFTMVTPNVKTHLHLLAKLAFLLHNPELLSLLHRPGTKEELMAAICTLEKTVIKK